MRKILQIISFALLTVVVSCGNNEPTVYTNIKGAWRCDENSVYGFRTYIVEIDRMKNDTTQYLLSNFHKVDELEFVFAKLTGSNLKLTDNQPIGTSQISLRSGAGVVSADFKQIKLDYKIYDGITDLEVSAIYSR